MKIRQTVSAISVALLTAAVPPAFADSVDKQAARDMWSAQSRDYYYDRGRYDNRRDRYDDRYDRRGTVHRHDRDARIVHRTVVERPVVVHRPPVRVSERPVYVDRPVYVEPGYGYGYGYDNGYQYAPAYESHRSSVAGTVGGAILGAVIGNQVSDREHRAAATAAGAVIGGVLGSGF
jgi:hypothetical protein